MNGHESDASEGMTNTTSPSSSIDATSTSSARKTQNTAAPASTPSHLASSVTHEESVGRPVSRSELPPEVQAKIEKNRLAALERKAKHEKKLESERLIAKELGSNDIIERNAQLLHKAMEAVEPLPKHEWTKFYDYDLSKMKDTRAGFIQDLDKKDAVGSRTDADEENMKKRKWQPSTAEPDPSIFLGAEDNYECQDCTSIDIDFQLLRHFHVPVCIGCRDAQPEKYSLLTKTECRADYLLTDPELRDTELFPYWERPNPKKATWNNMMLYLRYQVEEFAFKKWGGPEGLDREFERRERDKETRKEIKFKKELRDLRNKTRTSVWLDKKSNQRAKVHKHNFGTALVDPSSGASVQTCIECGIQVECEEF
ncbi:hypothetical protein BGX21_000796 [Mortierella sp. AD011]|nr:hypothetical protein BGX20_003102 [Mortierella sp. AD010]KAF9401730.1 hypothetical protein BGX21_000796 [Mortierella sp. AD011]